MKKSNQGILEILSALLVLFSTMLDPIISATLAIVLLVSFGIYHLKKN